MRLITANVIFSKGVVQLEDFSCKPKPRYAILSHRWRDHEVTFADIPHATLVNWPGQAFVKIRGAARQTLKCGLSHIWIDTCCINKDSSAELSEAINSMFNWYRESQHCYVYLHDVLRDDATKPIERSEWFSRGWTLQELLAPPKVSFFDCQWQYLGDRADLSPRISNITGIDIEALRGRDLTRYSIAQKMSWAAKRQTTRVEDTAYCLLGLFDVNMPLLYGEGEKAFYRLQEEIIKDSDDHSIFAWNLGTIGHSGLFAPSPNYFASCGHTKIKEFEDGSSPFSMTNRGLSISLKITPWLLDTYLAFLPCSRLSHEPLIRRPHHVCIFLRRLSQNDQFARVSLNGQCQRLDKEGIAVGNTDREVQVRQVFVRKFVNYGTESFWLTSRIYGFLMPRLPPLSGAQVSFTNHERAYLANGDCAAILHEGQWGPVMTIDLSNGSTGLKRITLGFDFEFNAVCILEDSFKDDAEASSDTGSDFNWKTIESANFHWNDVEGGERIHRKADHDGIWALRADRFDGIHAMLSEQSAEYGPVVKLERTSIGGTQVWEFAIDAVDGPFCKTLTPNTDHSLERELHSLTPDTSSEKSRAPVNGELDLLSSSITETILDG